MGQNAPGSLRASFDPVFYAAAYPDAALQCGNDPEALYHHYITFGLNMGYAGNAYFNLYKYRAAHPAFGSLYGNDWEAWLRGFYTTGLTGGGKPDYKRNDELKALTEARGYDSSDSSDSFDGNSISDGNGNILIPVSEIGRYLTLDELRERCGDSLILVTDAEGYVTFVGGHFTDVQASDDHDSEKAIECMLKLRLSWMISLRNWKRTMKLCSQPDSKPFLSLIRMLTVRFFTVKTRTGMCLNI